MNFEEIKKSANAYFSTSDFSTSEATGFQETKNELPLVDNEGPVYVVSENTYGTGENLVFNEMSSCLGIISYDQENKTISGEHFLLPTDEEEKEGVLDTIIWTLSEISEKGIYKLFGGSEKDWIARLSDLAENEGINVEQLKESILLEGPEAQNNCWFFSVHPIVDGNEEEEVVMDEETPAFYFKTWKFERITEE